MVDGVYCPKFQVLSQEKSYFYIEKILFVHLCDPYLVLQEV